MAMSVRLALGAPHAHMGARLPDDKVKALKSALNLERNAFKKKESSDLGAITPYSEVASSIQQMLHTSPQPTDDSVLATLNTKHTELLKVREVLVTNSTPASLDALREAFKKTDAAFKAIGIPLTAASQPTDSQAARPSASGTKPFKQGPKAPAPAKQDPSGGDSPSTLEGDLEDVDDSLEKVERIIDNATQGLEDIQKLVSELMDNTSTDNAKIQQVMGKLKNVTQSLNAKAAVLSNTVERVKTSKKA